MAELARARFFGGNSYPGYPRNSKVFLRTRDPRSAVFEDMEADSRRHLPCPAASLQATYTAVAFTQ